MSTLVSLAFLETHSHYRISKDRMGWGQRQEDELGADRWTHDQRLVGQWFSHLKVALKESLRTCILTSPQVLQVWGPHSEDPCCRWQRCWRRGEDIWKETS